MGYQRTVNSLGIDLLKRDNRMARPTMSIEERTKRALERGEALLAQARLASRLAKKDA